MLLILAGVAIATLTGDNGVLTKASSSKLKNEQATVKEQIILAYGEYQIEVKTSNNVKLASTEPVKARSNSQTFLQYLESKEYINSDGIVNVKNLTGNKMTLGNGTGKSDVYIISLNEEENKYVLNYYDSEEVETFLWEINAGSNKRVKINVSKTPETELSTSVFLKVTSVEGLEVFGSEEELKQKILSMEDSKKKEIFKKIDIKNFHVNTFEELLQYLYDIGEISEPTEKAYMDAINSMEKTQFEKLLIDGLIENFKDYETGEIRCEEIRNNDGIVSDTYLAIKNGVYTFKVKDFLTEEEYTKSIEVTNIDETKNYYVDVAFDDTYLVDKENDEKTTFEEAYVEYGEAKIDITNRIENYEEGYSEIWNAYIAKSLEKAGYYVEETVDVILVKDGISYLGSGELRWEE